MTATATFLERDFYLGLMSESLTEASDPSRIALNTSDLALTFTLNERCGGGRLAGSGSWLRTGNAHGEGAREWEACTRHQQSRKDAHLCGELSVLLFYITRMFRRSTFTRRPLHPLNTTPPSRTSPALNPSRATSL